MTMRERMARAFTETLRHHGVVMHPDDILGLADDALSAMREPTEGIERALAGSQARDDEGTFPRLADQLDFSGENKLWTVLRRAWTDAIDAAKAGA